MSCHENCNAVVLDEPAEVKDEVGNQITITKLAYNINISQQGVTVEPCMWTMRDAVRKALKSDVFHIAYNDDEVIRGAIDTIVNRTQIIMRSRLSRLNQVNAVKTADSVAQGTAVKVKSASKSKAKSSK